MSEIDAINESIRSSKETIRKAEAIHRLKKNDDFKTIILEDYLRNFAAHLVHSKALVQLQDDKQQKFLDGQIAGVGYFVQYMDMVLTAGVTAQAALESHEEVMHEILTEETM